MSDMEAIRRERQTEALVRGLDPSGIVDWVHALQDREKALKTEVERLREALELIAHRGEVFDAKGTHSKWVCDIARAALAGEGDE